MSKAIVTSKTDAESSKETDVKKDVSSDDDSESEYGSPSDTNQAKYADFRGLDSVLKLFKQYVPDSSDQVILMDLYRTKQYDVCKEFYLAETSKTKDTINNVSFIKLSGILTHIMVSTHGVDGSGVGIIRHHTTQHSNGPKFHLNVTNNSNHNLVKKGIRRSVTHNMQKLSQANVNKEEQGQAFECQYTHVTATGGIVFKFLLNQGRVRFRVTYSADGFGITRGNSSGERVHIGPVQTSAGHDQYANCTIGNADSSV